jgi:hypothetical protein
MKAKQLSFPFIYFSESCLFNALRPIQIKNLFPVAHCAKKVTTCSFSRRPKPGVAREFDPAKENI